MFTGQPLAPVPMAVAVQPLELTTPPIPCCPYPPVETTPPAMQSPASSLFLSKMELVSRYVFTLANVEDIPTKEGVVGSKYCLLMLNV